MVGSLKAQQWCFRQKATFILLRVPLIIVAVTFIDTANSEILNLGVISMNGIVYWHWYCVNRDMIY